MKTTNGLPESICPICSTKFDAATSLQQYKPAPGDVSICIQCGNILQFGSDLELYQASKETIAELKKDLETWGEIIKIQTILFKEA